MSRKLDAAIAEELGYEVDTCQGEWLMWVGQNFENSVLVSEYSTDGNSMLELIEEMLTRGWYAEIRYSHTTGFYSARFYKRGGERTIFYVADTIPLAVAYAVYVALTGEGWTE